LVRIPSGEVARYRLNPRFSISPAVAQLKRMDFFDIAALKDFTFTAVGSPIHTEAVNGPTVVVPTVPVAEFVYSWPMGQFEMFVEYLRVRVPPAGTRYVELELFPRLNPIQFTVPIAFTAGMLDEFDEVTWLPEAVGLFMDMQLGNISVILETISGTAVGLEKVIVHVTGPWLTRRNEGETDFAAVRAAVAAGRMVEERNPVYLYLLPLFAAAHG
jgi:hypothetical protein